MLDWIRTPVIGPGPLGNGVWRRVHDRFARSVRRYRTVIEVVPSRPVRAELAEIAEDLDEILELVREACEHAQAVAPSEARTYRSAPATCTWTCTAAWPAPPPSAAALRSRR